MKLEKDQMLKLYTNMVRTRAFDDALCEGLKDGTNITFFHSARGHEAVGVGGCTFLREDDYIYPHHRGHGLPHIISKGASPAALYAEHAGKANGAANGVGSFHVAYPEVGVFGVGGTVGSNFPLAVGWAIAAQKRGKGQVVVIFFGDGGSNRGTAHEAMNWAAVWKLPVVWVCENNMMAQFVPISSAYPRENIADIAYGYGMPGVVVDGMDVLAVTEAVQEAVDRARAGEGPSLIECKAYRYHPHSEGREDRTHNQLRPKEELEAWMKRDPVDSFRAKLLKDGVLTKEAAAKIDEEAAAEVEEARRATEKSPKPDPSVLDQYLYAD